MKVTFILSYVWYYGLTMINTMIFLLIYLPWLMMMIIFKYQWNMLLWEKFLKCWINIWFTIRPLHCKECPDSIHNNWICHNITILIIWSYVKTREKLCKALIGETTKEIKLEDQWNTHRQIFIQLLMHK